MKKACFTLPILVVAALLAGCGGGSAKLGKDDIAVVGKTHVSAGDFQTRMDQAKSSYKQANQTFPKQGTTAYEAIKSKAVNLLVQQAELEEKAASMGIKITDKQVQTRLDAIKKQYFQGSQAKYLAQLKKQNLTDEQVRQDIKFQLVEEQLYNQVTKNVAVSNAEAAQYYAAHVQLYSQAQTRDVQYILVKSKSLAESLYAQLKSGDPKAWCTLAKKYSEDPSSKNTCGKASFAKGQTVKAFDTVLFAQPTEVVHAPVYDPVQYKAYFIIRPLSNVKPRKTTPLAQVRDSIKQQLVQQKKNTAMNTWVSGLEKQFCSGSKIKYQVGYTPSPDPCTSATTNATTT